MSSGLVLHAKRELVPGLECTSWLDDARLRLRMGEDGRRRPNSVTWLRGIVLHTTLGYPFEGGAQPCLPGKGPATDIEQRTNAWWSTNGKHGGAHLIIDFDGSVACLADLLDEETYHAGSVNPWTVGIEIAQRGDAGIYESQLDAVELLCEWLCRRLEIQRQIPRRELDYYEQGKTVPRCQAGGRDIVGVYGHRDVTRARGFGDPGDLVFARLERAGFEALDFSRDQDKEAWISRQKALGMAAGMIDGVPGPQTRAFVREWQAAQGFEVTGMLSADQRTILDSASA